MYPVRLGLKTALARIARLQKNGHHSEALVTSIFTLEKICRRTLKELVVSAGFTSKAATTLLNGFNGFEKMKNVWPCFDPEGQSLPELFGDQDWGHIKESVKMRNKLVHGARAYDLAICEAQTTLVVQALKNIESKFQTNYGYSGWRNNSIRRVSRLHADPKIAKSAQ